LASRATISSSLVGTTQIWTRLLRAWIGDSTRVASFAFHVDELVLEARRAEVRYEDLHGFS